jgi:hypothetical protein
MAGHSSPIPSRENEPLLAQSSANSGRSAVCHDLQKPRGNVSILLNECTEIPQRHSVNGDIARRCESPTAGLD